MCIIFGHQGVFRSRNLLVVDGIKSLNCICQGAWSFWKELPRRATSILDNNTWDGVQLVFDCKNEKRSLRKRIGEIRL